MNDHIPLTDAERNACAEYTLSTVLGEALSHGAVPLVLLAGTPGGKTLIMPCGPCTMAVVMDLLRGAVESYDAGQVSRERPKGGVN